ncbi:MAK10-like protein [Tanacetum coccineum]|uniref:MAK10-like protein n=1 Tax=Tanacetum coccineum TaxID=301880 RepID=A0ABQ5AB14_9ASTR
MGDENPIHTLRDYSKPSHEGYKNTIELPVGNNVVPFRSDTIRLVQNGCSFYRLQSWDPNQHLKDFLKLVDSLDLDGENRERTRLCLFQFSLCDQASNWLECLPRGRILLLVSLLNSFHQEGLQNSDLLQKVPHHGIDLWLQVQIFYDHVNPVTRQTIDQSTGGKLRDRNTKESWALLEDLALYDNESWNDPRDFAKSVKAITFPQDVLMNRITTPCEIYSGPHDTQYCMEDPEQAFVEYASSRTDEAREGLLSNFMASQDSRLSKFEADFKQQQSKMTNKIDIILKAITDRIAGTLPSDTVKNPKLSTSPTSQLQIGMRIRTQQPEEPEPTLEDEFQDLHLNLPVLEDLTHAPVYNVLLNKYRESLELGKNGSTFVQDEVSAKMEDPRLFTLLTMAGVDVNTLTMEQYLALSRENQAPGMVKPKIGGNVNFEIKSQFMCELKEDTFSGNKDKDAHDHIDRVIIIVGLFNIPGVTKDAVMLRVFPFTLTGATNRWVDRIAPGTINTWDLLKKAFIQRYCPPSMTTKQLDDIHNFKQEGDESLYQAWERYNNLLYKCSTHEINSYQKVNIFYKGLSTMNHQLLDSQGLIPMMRPDKALTAIQTMADHSQKWHDGSTSRNIRSSSSKDGLAALVGCQICEGPHLDKDYPLSMEVKQVEVVRYGEFGRTKPFNGNNGGRQTLTETKNQNHHNEIIQGLKSRVTTMAKEAVTKIDNNKDCKAIFTNDGVPLYTPFYYSPEEIEYFLANFRFSDDDELNNVTSIPEEDLKQTSPKQITTHYVEPYIPPIPFPKRLEQHAEEALIHKTMESLKKIKSN